MIIKKTLVESREGIDFENVEFRNMDRTIKEEIDKGYSFYMIVLDHPEFDITERILYYYQEKGYLSTSNIDLPRKVRYKKRKRIVSKNKFERKEQNCRIGRTYKEFTDYIEKNNIDYYVEMDTVEGIKGHSLLLTLCILPYNFLLAYKIEEQTISEITEKINKLKKELGFELFHKIFPIILTDNGSEFKRPDLIEDNGNDVIKTKVFFCDPNRSDQKGTIDFVKRSVVYFGCKLKIIQTDNGAEFTHIKKTDRIHPLDKICNSLHIEHKLIRPRTPRNNGKVERSHRNDQQRFYQFLKFYSYDDLLIQMKSYLKKSNNIPMQVLNWKTPLEIRNELSKIN